MKRKLTLLTKYGLCAILLLWSLVVSAQTIQGTVVDATNEPLIGASVVIEGTSKGSITDDKGNYTLDISGTDKNSFLVFSFVGFDNQRIPIDGRTTINITLSEGKALNEVVVVGYGIQKKRNLTASGTNFCKVVSTFTTDSKEPLMVAMGISYTNKPEILTNTKRGLLNIWESYLPQNGELGTSLILNPNDIKELAHDEKEKYVLVKAKSGKPITYYVGAGWTKNPHFKTKQDWLDYVNKEIAKLKF